MNLLYRDATEKDLPLIVEIYNSTIESRQVTADTEPVTVADKRKWFNNHHKFRPLRMIMAGITTVGWISFHDFYGRPAYSGTAEISIYLHPLFRNKGYGKAALSESLTWCPSLKIDTLLAFIFAHNTPSISLFQKAGFEEWGHLKNVALLDGYKYSVKILGISI